VGLTQWVDADLRADDHDRSRAAAAPSPAHPDGTAGMRAFTGKLQHSNQLLRILRGGHLAAVVQADGTFGTGL
jgi:hypothetical protein